MTERSHTTSLDAVARGEPNPGVAAYGNDPEAFTSGVLQRAYDAGQRALQGDKVADLLLNIRPMRSLVTRYLIHVQQTTGFRAIWPPDTHLSVGDIAELRDELLVPVSSLGELGLEVASTIEEQVADQSIAYGRARVELDPHDALSLLAKAPSAKHILRIAFGDFGAFLAVFRTTATSRLQPDGFADQLLGLEREGKWQGDWVLITEVIQTNAGAVLMSGADEARVEFAVPDEAMAAAEAALPVLLMRPDVTPAASVGMSSVLMWNQPATPLVKGHRVKRGFLTGGSSLVPVM
jgi:hypothetical protein